MSYISVLLFIWAKCCVGKWQLETEIIMMLPQYLCLTYLYYVAFMIHYKICSLYQTLSVGWGVERKSLSIKAIFEM